MKNYLLLLSLLLMAFTSQAQVVTGVYKGKMEVDSPKYTVDFELTLKEKDGKLVGYCQRLFIVEDVLYYNLVKVTARIADSVLIVEDEKSVSNNFKEKTSGVKTVMFFKIQTNHDTVSVMPGEWSTSRTKKFLPITGSVSVSRERNYLATQLYKRLDEKQLTKEMLFEEKIQPKQSDIAANQPTNNAATTQQNAATKNPVQVNTAINNTETQTKPSDIAFNQNKPTTQQQQSTIAKDSAKNNSTAVVNNPQTKPSDVAVNQNKPVTQNQQQQQNIVIDTAKNNATAVVNKPKPTPTDVTVTQNKPTAQNHQQQTITQKDTIKSNTTAGATQPKPTDVAVNQNKPVIQSPQQQPAITKDSARNNSTAPATKQQGQTTNVAVNQNKPSAQTQPQSTTVNKPQTSQPVANNTNAAINKPNTQPVDQKPVTPVAPTQQQTSISTIGTTIVENTSGKPVAPSKQPVINNPVLVTRQIEIIDALELSGDSVILSLYDNGEIDGDTVSVFLNNELLLSKIGLTANAFKKTIPINNGETIQLTLFAENLGRIPPNSGLLVITTNNERYQVHFTSTLNKNASVVLRRKE